MGIFLNSTAPFEPYKITALDKYFVDKTMLIEELIPSIGREQRFLCITRPRRFGKTVMANMVASYFGKAIDSSFVFEHENVKFFCNIFLKKFEIFFCKYFLSTYCL